MLRRGLWRQDLPVWRARRELDRALDEAFGQAFGRMATPGRWATRRRQPLVNLWEDGENVYAEAEMPGFDQDQIEILVEGTELKIRGHRQTEEEEEGVAYHRRERDPMEFNRIVDLPVEIDSERVSASLENGVLTVTLPKAASARPRRIEVKAARRS